MFFDDNRKIDGASIASRESEEPDEKLLSEPMAIRVNIKTNMAVFYENGKPTRTWKVATARKDGQSNTPTGTFRVNELNVCPPWTSTRTAKFVDRCADDNPLGHFALWFDPPYYGLHGVDLVDPDHKKSVTASSAEERRQSSGCVRNHPNDIRWLAEKVAPLYGASKEEFQKIVADKRYVPFKPKDPNGGVVVLIGNWASDPKVAGPSSDKKVASASPSSPYPPPPVLPPPANLKGRAVANTVASKNGAPIRFAPQDLAILGPGGSCMLPAGQAITFNSATQYGNFIRAEVAVAPTSCPRFFGTVFLYREHFTFTYDYGH
jgi:hypothetical protein